MFIDRLYEFGESLKIQPEKYPINRFPKYKNRNYRTAIFDRNYIFFYRYDTKFLNISNIVHTSRLK